MEIVREFIIKNKGEIQKEFEHPETKTSEESAKYRGVDLHFGAKAILLKVGKKNKQEFVVAVVPADLGVDSKKIKKHLKVKNVRFGNEDELVEKCKCVKGSLPPFGSIYSLKTIIDTEIFNIERIYFNCGKLTNSFCITTKDYEKILKSSSSEHEIFDFSKKIIKKNK